MSIDRIGSTDRMRKIVKHNNAVLQLGYSKDKAYHALALMVFLAGCSYDRSSQNDPGYDDSSASWKSSGVKSYIYNYEATGFSPLKGEWEIQVEQSEVIFVAYEGSDPPALSLTLEDAPSIDSLLVDIEACIDDDGAKVTRLSFDESVFVPLEFLCENSSESYGFTISGFKAL